MESMVIVPTRPLTTLIGHSALDEAEIKYSKECRKIRRRLEDNSCGLLLEIEAQLEGVK